MRCRAIAMCVVGLAAVAAGAAPPQSNESRTVAKSFAWNGSAIPGGASQERIVLRQRVEERLAAAGYRPAGAAAPDFWVALHVARQNPEDLGAGTATLVVDLVHAPSGVLIWRSFDSDLSGASLATARFSNLTTYAWKDIPARPGVEPPYVATDRAIRGALAAGLLFRDWKVAPDQASAGALVTYRVVARGADIRAPMQAVLTAELIDPWSNTVLWKGEQAGPVLTPEKVEDAAIEAVAALAKQVPASPAATAPK